MYHFCATFCQSVLSVKPTLITKSSLKVITWIKTITVCLAMHIIFRNNNNDNRRHTHNDHMISVFMEGAQKTNKLNDGVYVNKLCPTAGIKDMMTHTDTHAHTHESGGRNALMRLLRRRWRGVEGMKACLGKSPQNTERSKHRSLLLSAEERSIQESWKKSLTISGLVKASVESRAQVGYISIY